MIKEITTPPLRILLLFLWTSLPLTSVGDAKDLSSCCSYGSHAVGEGYAQLGRGFPGGSVAGFTWRIIP